MSKHIIRVLTLLLMSPLPLLAETAQDCRIDPSTGLAVPRTGSGSCIIEHGRSYGMVTRTKNGMLITLPKSGEPRFEEGDGRGIALQFRGADTMVIYCPNETLDPVTGFPKSECVEPSNDFTPGRSAFVGDGQTHGNLLLNQAGAARSPSSIITRAKVTSPAGDSFDLIGSLVLLDADVTGPAGDATYNEIRLIYESAGPVRSASKGAEVKLRDETALLSLNDAQRGLVLGMMGLSDSQWTLLQRLLQMKEEDWEALPRMIQKEGAVWIHPGGILTAEALAPGGVRLTLGFQEIFDAVNTVGTAVTNVGVTVVDNASKITTVQGTVNAVQGTVTAIQGAVNNTGSTVDNLASTVKDLAKTVNDIQGFVDTIKTALTKLRDKIETQFPGGISAIQDVIEATVAFIKDHRDEFDAFKSNDCKGTDPCALFKNDLKKWFKEWEALLDDMPLMLDSDLAPGIQSQLIHDLLIKDTRPILIYPAYLVLEKVTPEWRSFPKQLSDRTSQIIQFLKDHKTKEKRCELILENPMLGTRASIADGSAKIVGAISKKVSKLACPDDLSVSVAGEGGTAIPHPCRAALALLKITDVIAQGTTAFFQMQRDCKAEDTRMTAKKTLQSSLDNGNALGNLREREIEQSLGSCQFLVADYLPKSSGGLLDEVLALVKRRLQQSLAEGLAVGQADSFVQRAEADIQAKKYKSAYNNLCRAYSQMNSSQGS